MTLYFIQAFIYLLAAVVAVPLAKRFGLGSVLGYLAGQDHEKALWEKAFSEV
ncbi:hypothetical protein [Zobellella endophytica]|uniref:hypothetical protein n=1 Tax=Zobellella endophytica TaxID=2116700 RepID=UPI001304B657|nr:hypothetical protein [Zobellella endophytica]